MTIKAQTFVAYLLHSIPTDVIIICVRVNRIHGMFSKSVTIQALVDFKCQFNYRLGTDIVGEVSNSSTSIIHRIVRIVISGVLVGLMYLMMGVMLK